MVVVKAKKFFTRALMRNIVQQKTFVTTINKRGVAVTSLQLDADIEFRASIANTNDKLVIPGLDTTQPFSKPLKGSFYIACNNALSAGDEDINVLFTVLDTVSVISEKL